jgi:thioester reductase-like protein
VWEGVAEPVQVVHRDVPVDLHVADWSGCGEDEQRRRLAAHLDEDRREGFDPAVPPLVRAAVFRLGPDAHRLVWSTNHMLLDGWSLPIVAHEFLLAYEAARRGAAPALPRVRPFRDYIAWLRSQDAGRAEDHWRAALAGVRGPTPVPVDHGRLDRSATSREIVTAQLDDEGSGAIARAARSLRVTPSALFDAAWALLLREGGGGDDVVFGTTVSGRPAELDGADRMVGLFINTVPRRVALDDGETVSDLVARIHRDHADAQPFEHAPVVDIARWSAVPRGVPLFHSLLLFQSFPAAVEVEGASIRLTDIAVDDRTGYPLTVVVVPGPRLGVGVSYDPTLFAAWRMQATAERLLAVAAELAADPACRVGDLARAGVPPRPPGPQDPDELALPASIPAPSEADLADAPAYAAFLDRTGATVACLPPRAWRRLLADGLDVGERRAVSVGGPTPADVAAALRGLPQSTEVVVGAGRVLAARRLASAAEHATVLAGLGAAVVAADGRPAGVGVAGDLRIVDTSGDEVATGLTGRWRPGGVLDVTGERDDTVAVRGIAVRLGELEQALLATGALADVAVVADPAPADGDDVRLTAYVVGRAGEPAQHELWEALDAHLPHAGVDLAFVPVARIPLDADGRPDRGRLPAAEREPRGEGGGYEPPGTAEEEALAAVWAEVLGVERVGRRDDFFELGGDSLLAVDLVARVEVTYDVTLPIRSLFEDPTVAGLLAVVHDTLAGVAPADRDYYDEDRALDLAAEARLPDDVRPRPGRRPPGEGDALLTGVGSLLGAHVAAALAADGRTVHCLVPAPTRDEAAARLEEALRRFGAWDDALAGRIVPVLGHVTRPGLGLDAGDRAALVAEVGDVFHLAEISHSSLLPYAALRAMNVASTVEVLRLAAAGAPPARAHLLSTLRVLPVGGRLDEAAAPPPGARAGSYEMSKWVAEQLVDRAADRGLPARVYRVGELAGHSVTGHCDVDAPLARLVVASLQAGAILRRTLPMVLTPVDFVARAIAWLAGRPDDLGRYVHVIDPADPRARTLRLAPVLRREGYELDEVSHLRWRSLINKAAEGRDDRAILHRSEAYGVTLARGRLRRSVHELRAWQEATFAELDYGCAVLARGLAGSGLVCPPVDDDLLARSLRFADGVAAAAAPT